MDELNPIAEALFPMYGGDGGGGGVGGGVAAPVAVNPSSVASKFPLVPLVKCETVKAAVKALLARGTQAPPRRHVPGSDPQEPRHNGQINSAFCKGYLGLVVWKLMVDREGGKVPWVKPTSFKSKERQEKFEALVSALFHVYANDITNVIKYLEIKPFVVTYGGLNAFCNNLKRKKSHGLWVNTEEYDPKKNVCASC